MNAILAACMASLFAWWIWSLKQELAHSHSQPAANPGSTQMEEPNMPMVEHKPRPPERPIYQDSPKRRNSGGVAVWTIT
ncbi:MAG: hypothetical protein K8T26_10570 [Lentisphaerae bacterium]|nr:hypothetical protein [Lentisphaerota bacterium]